MQGRDPAVGAIIGGIAGGIMGAAIPIIAAACGPEVLQGVIITAILGLTVGGLAEGYNQAFNGEELDDWAAFVNGLNLVLILAYHI